MTDTYTVLSQVPVNRWIPELQEAREGYDVTARWLSTGTVVKVFVPRESYNGTNVDAAIRTEGYKHDEVAALGAGSARAS